MRFVNYSPRHLRLYLVCSALVLFSAGILLKTSGSLAAAGLRLSALRTAATQTAGTDGDQNWDPFYNIPGPDGAITALGVSGDDVYVGGRFRNIGGQPFSGIARYNLTSRTWSALAGGLAALNSGDNTLPNAIAVRGDDVYVGGNFRAVRNDANSVLPVGGVARWNKAANTWSALGGGAGQNGVEGDVRALAVLGNDVYVGGQFLNVFNGAQRLTASGVARWDTAANTWSVLGTDGQSNTGNGVGFPPATPGETFFTAVNSLAVIGSDLYVGGAFRRAFSGPATSVSANNVARWNTQTST
ncbi:MAG: hypothetical protein ACKV2V_22270 [Blastocatellia bacterium]